MRRYVRLGLLVGLVGVLFGASSGETSASPGTITLVSVSTAGSQGNFHSMQPSISDDGLYVAFTSQASNLLSCDAKGVGDVLVRDRGTSITRLVSVDSSGCQSDQGGGEPAVSSDGRYIAFQSGGSDLVSGETNNSADVFVHDRQTGITERVSIDSDGIQGNGWSTRPDTSSDGRYVAFDSMASNLVTDDTNSVPDIFVHDRQTGTTERVSVDSAGNQANKYSDRAAISADGRYVAFPSPATNLGGGSDVYADCFLRDRQDGVTELVAGSTNGSCSAVDVSADGRYVAFDSDASDLVPGDSNGAIDVFLLDRGPGSVGGVAELPSVLDSSASNYVALAGSVAAVLVAFTAGAWYARRRWGR